MLNDCSPGFWKNHTELWQYPYCGGPTGCFEDLMEALTFKGPGEIRHQAAATLNAWADTELGLVCTD